MLIYKDKIGLEYKDYKLIKEFNLQYSLIDLSNIFIVPLCKEYIKSIKKARSLFLNINRNFDLYYYALGMPILTHYHKIAQDIQKNVLQYKDKINAHKMYIKLFNGIDRLQHLYNTLSNYIDLYRKLYILLYSFIPSILTHDNRQNIMKFLI